MTIYTLPSSPAIRRSSFGKVANTRYFTSPLNGRTQTVELPGARWQASYTLPAMTRAKAATWQAWLARLQGMAGRFYAYDPDARTPRGTATGTPLVKGASQTGLSLITDGWTSGVTGILLAGDYIAFDTSAGRELRMVVADATSDGSGNATLTLDAPIRTSPADNEPLILTDPSCIMMLADDTVTWDADEAGVYTLAFAAVEAYGA